MFKIISSTIEKNLFARYCFYELPNIFSSKKKMLLLVCWRLMFTFVD